MGDIYRVTVTREGAETDDVSVVVELAAPVEMLRQFAPSAVAAALGTTAMDAAMTTRIDPEPEAPTEQKERRRRRTKAEMEAARAAESNTPEERATPERASIAMSGPVETAVYNPFELM